MTESSYGLRVALSTKGSSVGELYLDDGHSFQYLHQKQFLHRKFSFCSSVLINSSADQRGHYPSKCVVEQILVLGLKKEPSFVTTHSSDGKDQPVAFTYCAKTSSLSLENLSLNIATDWEVRIIWQRTAPGDVSRDLPVPFNLPLAFFEICAAIYLPFLSQNNLSFVTIILMNNRFHVLNFQILHVKMY